MTEEIKRGPGRPRINKELHVKAYNVNLRKDEKALIDEAVEINGWNFSKFMRLSSLAYANKVIEDKKAFTDFILNVGDKVLNDNMSKEELSDALKEMIETDKDNNK